MLSLVFHLQDPSSAFSNSAGEVLPSCSARLDGKGSPAWSESAKQDLPALGSSNRCHE